MNKFFILSLTAILLFSCQKETVQPQPQPTINKPAEGLTVKIMDEFNNPIKGKIEIDQYINGDLIRIAEDSIYENGIYEAGKLLEGWYSVFVYANKGKKQYWDSPLIWMKKDTTVTLELFPYNNSGNLNVTVTDTNGNVLTDVNVVLLPHGYKTATIAELMDNACEISPVNEYGMVQFNLPALPFSYFSLLVYRSATEYEYPPQGFIEVDKGQNIQKTIVVNL